jgi:lipooligosaccharide transport system permease protein
MVDWRSWAVLKRNAFVYLRNWRTAFLPPALEPLIFFVALGMGLRGYVQDLTFAGQPIDYATYVAPGLLAYTGFSTPFFESLYSSYVRMHFQKTWDGILATQVELKHILWGEILWAGCRGGMNAVAVVLMLGLFDVAGVIDLAWWWLPFMPPIGMVAGWTFAAFGLIFTAIVPAIDHMNYPVFLIGVPLGLVSNTYFPVPTDQTAVAIAVMLNPVYHLAETFRAFLVTGGPGEHGAWLIGTLALYLVICSTVAQRKMRTRVLGE